MSDPVRPTRRRRTVRIVLGSAMGIVAVAAVWAGVTFYDTWSRSDGEPASVIIATWMRDNNMGPVVAQLENVYYTYIETPEVGGSPTISADLAAEDAAGLVADDLEDSSEPSDSSDAGVQPVDISATESEPLLLTPIDRERLPTAQPTPSPASGATGRAHLDPPPPIVSPVDDPEPKEGEWQPVGTRVDGIPTTYVTRVRADNVHTSYYASVMWIDTELTKAMFIPGYEEPGGPNPYDGALPKEYWPDVVANFNGGFRLDDSRGGYYYEGEMVRPLVKGRASAVVYTDGTVKVGKWGRDLKMTPDVVAVRQNLDLIVDKGASKVSNGADNIVWGATTDKESMAWRGAVGERPDGSIVYVGSPFLSADGLADVLVGAGVDRAMVLDMNTWWTAGFYFRHKKNGEPVCRKLDPAISGDCDRFLKPYKRDSFQFLVRDEPMPTAIPTPTSARSTASASPDPSSGTDVTSTGQSSSMP